MGYEMPQKYLWLWFFCCFFLRVINLTFQAFQKQFCKFHVTPAFSCSKSDSIQGCIGIEHVLIEEQKSAFERKGGILTAGKGSDDLHLAISK